MQYKFIIPKIYFLHCNLHLMNMINDYMKKKPITVEVYEIGKIINNIIKCNKKTWTNYNAVDLNNNFLEYLCRQYLRRYRDTRLVDWNVTIGEYPQPTRYDFLIYLIFMMGNPADTRLANVEYDDDVLKLELEPKGVIL